MTTQGYIQIYRGIFDEVIYKEPFDICEAWIDLLLMAAFVNGCSTFFKGKQVQLKRGQVDGSIAALAKRWSITPKKARGYFDKWIERGQIVRDAQFYNAPIFTIVNYDKHQKARGNQKGHKEGINNGTSSTAATADISAVYEDAKTEKGTSSALTRESIGAHNNKEIINNNILSSSKTRTREEEDKAYFEDALYTALAKDTEWLNLMAMRYTYKVGMQDAAEALQPLYAKIKECREQFFLDGKTHESISDLKQHLRATIKKKLKQETQNASNQTINSNGSAKQPIDRKRGAEPSNHFTDKL